MKTKKTSTKEEFKKQHNLTEGQFIGKEKVGGDLYLRSLTSIPEGFNPTVGGDLYLSSLTSIPEGFNPTVGGDLYLRSLTSIPEGFNPTVGGDLVLKNSRKRIGSNVQVNVIKKRDFIWQVGDKKYAKIDGIFCELLVERDRIIKGETFKIFSAKKVNKEEFFYIANKGNFFAHGQDIKKAFEDLEFKLMAEKLKNEPIKKDTVITINYYRLLTGSCEIGVKSWMLENGIKDKEIKAEDLLPILIKTNAYGLDKFKKLVTF